MSNPLQVIKADWSLRPWWMNLMFWFCLYMTFLYMPFDVFVKPLASDHEIWFGIALHGWWAKATEPLHWLIYAAGARGFWKMKGWMWPWAALYSAQVTVAMLVWNVVNPNGQGLAVGVVSAIVFAIPTVALWRARDYFGTNAAESVSESGTIPAPTRDEHNPLA
jgi:hypothetical protein